MRTYYMYKITIEGPTKKKAKVEHTISALGYTDAVNRAHEFFDDEGNIVDVECMYEIRPNI